jgi:hypothetical protein
MKQLLDTHRVGKALYFKFYLFTFKNQTMENVFQFQHEAEKINDALGLSYEQDAKCREVIFFSAFSNYFIGVDLFDNEEERPKSLSTLTGDLEKALSLLKDDREKSYMLLLFKTTHNLALEIIAKYRVLETLEPSERKRMDLLLGLLECKLEDKKQEENNFDYYSPSEMFKRIDYAKESLYNFQNYLNLVNEKL